MLIITHDEESFQKLVSLGIHTKCDEEKHRWVTIKSAEFDKITLQLKDDFAFKVDMRLKGTSSKGRVKSDKQSPSVNQQLYPSFYFKKTQDLTPDERVKMIEGMSKDLNISPNKDMSDKELNALRYKWGQWRKEKQQSPGNKQQSENVTEEKETLDSEPPFDI
ncbi:MAG: hypothetical protein ABIK73_06115 [candidate division WOR-3 bacterium]